MSLVCTLVRDDEFWLIYLDVTTKDVAINLSTLGILQFFFFIRCLELEQRCFLSKKTLCEGNASIREAKVFEYLENVWIIIKMRKIFLFYNTIIVLLFCYHNIII